MAGLCIALITGPSRLSVQSVMSTAGCLFRRYEPGRAANEAMRLDCAYLRRVMKELLTRTLEGDPWALGL